MCSSLSGARRSEDLSFYRPAAETSFSGYTVTGFSAQTLEGIILFEERAFHSPPEYNMSQHPNSQTCNP